MRTAPSPGRPTPRPGRVPPRLHGNGAAAAEQRSTSSAALSPGSGRHVAGVSSTGTWKAWGALVHGAETLKGMSSVICQAVEAGTAATSRLHATKRQAQQ